MLTTTTPSGSGGPGPQPLLRPASPALVASLSAAAGAIHIGIAPSHGGASGTDALAFALMGWAQLLVAGAILVRPARPRLLVGIAINVVALAAWAVSRTAGLPIGPHAGSVEAIGTVDAVCAGLGAAFVVAAAARLVNRRIVIGLPFPIAALGTAGVLTAATLALAAPSTVGHHDHDGNGELATGPVGATGAAAAAPSTTTTAAPAHAHAAAGANDHDDDHAAGHAEGADHAATHADTAEHADAAHAHDGTGGPAHDDHAAGATASHDHAAAAPGTGGHAHNPGTPTDPGHAHNPGTPTDPGHAHDPGTPTDPTHPHDPTDPTHPHDPTPAPDPATVAVDYGPAGRCDLGFNPTGYYRDATLAGTDFVNGPTAADLAMPHTMSEVEAARLVQRLADGTNAEYYAWLMAGQAHAHGAARPAAATAGPDHHNGPQAWKAITDQAACQKLADELASAKAAALRYPRASDAVAAGYERVTPYVMGIGAHYVKSDLVDGEWDPNQPEMILYDGNEGNAHVVGLSYEVWWEQETEPVVGFTGRNDRYHRHTTLCFKDGVTIGDSSMSEGQCEALGGSISDGRYLWMSHAWVVPGCESPWGVFSQMNPLLDISLGNASGTSPGCAASTGHQNNRWVFTPPVAPLPGTPIPSPPLGSVAVLPGRE